MNFTCSICENSANVRIHRAREMMFGTREEFDYLECARCGTVQIVEVPSDLGRHYPPDYFAFNAEMHIDLAQTLGRRIAARFAGDYLLNGGSRIGKFIVEKKSWIEYHFPDSFKDFPGELNFKSRI